MAEISPLQRQEVWLNENNTPTLRFAEVIEDLISQVNALEDFIVINQINNVIVYDT